MKKLREIKKAVEKYKKVLYERPWIIKQDLKKYQNDVEILLAFLQTYEKECEKKLKKLRKINLEEFSATTKGCWGDIKQRISLNYIHFYLVKYSTNKEIARRLKKDLQKIKERFMQFQYFS